MKKEKRRVIDIFDDFDLYYSKYKDLLIFSDYYEYYNSLKYLRDWIWDENFENEIFHTYQTKKETYTALKTIIKNMKCIYYFNFNIKKDVHFNDLTFDDLKILNGVIYNKLQTKLAKDYSLCVNYLENKRKPKPLF